MPEGAALIGVDWGTTSLRAFLLDRAGKVIDRRGGAYGIMNVADGDFAGTLGGQIGGWLDAADVPVLMSGMIGSRQGWVEAPYVACPAGLGDLAGRLTRAPYESADVRVIPGVRTAAAMPDVMRGEEMQVIGAIATGAAGLNARLLLPGTHSKWVRVEAGRIADFATYMTGEIFAACRDHTILGRLMTEGADPQPEAFRRGVEDGAASGGPGSLLHRLFAVRSAGLFGALQAAELPDYLSGLLIGAELADATSEDADRSGLAIAIIASDLLGERYRVAAEELGMAATLLDPDCVVAGHLAIARSAGLLG
jgi:2-dehydro-3-deoxygalactonokinase